MRYQSVLAIAATAVIAGAGCAGVNPLSDWDPIGDFLQSEVDKERKPIEERERKAEVTDRERDRAIAEERREQRRSR